MVTNSFRNKNMTQGRRRLNIDRQGPNLFSFGSRAEVCFWVFCSHRVPNVFLNMFPLEPHFYSICFAQSYPLLSSRAGPRGRKCSICRWKLLFWGASRVSGLCLWWPMKMAHCPKKKKKTWEATPHLMNWNSNILP